MEFEITTKMFEEFVKYIYFNTKVIYSSKHIGMKEYRMLSLVDS